MKLNFHSEGQQVKVTDTPSTLQGADNGCYEVEEIASNQVKDLISCK